MRKIHKLDLDNERVCAKLTSYLAPHEPHALFILGNLNQRFPGSHIYVAQAGDTWVGVAGYYAGPRSLIPFSDDPDVVRALVRHVVARHPDIQWVNGIDYAARPAYEELLALGFRPDNDPHQAFMELEGEPPRQAHEELARPMREGDHERVARLLRQTQNVIAPDAALTEGELNKVRRNPLRHVVEVDGRAVSTASTNGIGINAFQILGVATDPEYRRRGCARAVCAALVRSMARKGAKRCVLFSARGNTPAIRCYESLGFRTTGSYYVAKVKPATATG